MGNCTLPGRTIQISYYLPEIYILRHNKKKDIFDKGIISNIRVYFDIGVLRKTTYMCKLFGVGPRHVASGAEAAALCAAFFL